MGSMQNLEEAGFIASEFISDLDYLPSEVQHLLLEIKHKELRSQELQQEIARDQARYIKHALRQSSVTPSPAPSTPEAATSGATRSPTPNSKPHLPARIAASFAEMDQLSDEKVALAQRVIELLTRTKARLDASLARVRVLQGEPEETRARSSPYSSRRLPVYSYGGGLESLSPAQQISDNLRTAHATSSAGEVLALAPILPASNTSNSNSNKKRRLVSSAVKQPSPAPPPVSASTAASYARSRLSRQIHLPRPADVGVDGEAEGNEDAEGEDAEEDQGLYCLCHKQSYGDMIGCDNPDCPYQWFHITCVGVKTPLPDKWYCPECKGRSAGSGVRKGRKK